MSFINKIIKKINAIDGDDYLITFVNPYSYLLLRKHESLVIGVDKIHIDGILLVNLFHLIGLKKERKSFDMTSLAPIVFNDCIRHSKSIYFIGSTDIAIENFINTIKSEYNELDIIGYRNGYFNTKNEKNNFINNLSKLEPNVVVVGMGTPHQEEFLIALKKAGWKGKGYTCGGFIHQTALGINYYPKLYDKYNLRWLYRMVDEPILIKRYLLLYPVSVCLFIFDVIKYKLIK